MFGIGSMELVIILVFGFLLFGPDKLPQMGRTIGRALRQFRETQEKLTAVVQTEVVDPMAAAAKQPTVKTGAAQAADSDADVDSDEAPKNPTAGPARKETFAERRARLAAERAEAEAAKAAAAEGEGAGEAASAEGVAASASSSVEVGADSAAASDATGASSAASTAAVAACIEDSQEDEVLTTEDLYARRPRKRKAAAVEDAPAEAAPATPADPQKGGEQ